MNNYFLELTKDELKAIITALEIARHDYPDTAATTEQEEALIKKTADLLTTNPDDQLHSVWSIDAKNNNDVIERLEQEAVGRYAAKTDWDISDWLTPEEAEEYRQAYKAENGTDPFTGE